MARGLFITGMGRSGTTFVDKIFGCFSSVESFSQPLPLLLVQLKADFLHAQGISDYRSNYPLSDQQFENAFDISEFTSFLNHQNLSPNYIESVLEKMANYSGQYFKPKDRLASLSNWQGGTLSKFIRHYFTTHRPSARQGPNVFAWKETVAEEFIPYFLQQEFLVLLIVRDPRDVVISMCTTNAKAYAGLPRPILWTARQWRKSIAFRHQYEKEGQIRHVLYEDFVRSPDTFIRKWARWVGVGPAEEFTNLTDKNGQEWTGNSSFSTHHGIPEKSVGRHLEFLSSPMRRFVEALCYGEMKALGYEPTIATGDVESLLRKGPQEDFLEREALAHYSYSELRQQEELARWRALTSRDGRFCSSQFVFERNFRKIRQILGN